MHALHEHSSSNFQLFSGTDKGTEKREGKPHGKNQGSGRGEYSAKEEVSVPKEPLGFS